MDYKLIIVLILLYLCIKCGSTNKMKIDTSIVHPAYL